MACGQLCMDFWLLKSDLETVAGIGFYEHAETPGLGGEVDNPNWKASWVGKQAYNQGDLDITVLKARADMSRAGSESQIDGLAGATLTTRGVDNLVRYWLGDQGFQTADQFFKIRGGLIMSKVKDTLLEPYCRQ